MEYSSVNNSLGKACDGLSKRRLSVNSPEYSGKVGVNLIYTSLVAGAEGLIGW